MNDAVLALNASRERPASTMSGYVMLVALLLTVAVAAWGLLGIIDGEAGAARFTALIGGALLFGFVSAGFYMLQPNQAAAITLFGSYAGTDRTNGLRWVLPWLMRHKVSVRAHNFISDKIKVNDLRGNPIEMAAQIVWRVVDTAQALFDVDDYKEFVKVQVEAAIRTIGARYPYDDFEHKDVTLRGHIDEVGGELKKELWARRGSWRRVRPWSRGRSAWSKWRWSNCRRRTSSTLTTNAAPRWCRT
jgi:regulator of protease activity HflC (stomatin/prohibitin superfamily)